MSNENERYKSGRRRQKTENAVNKQLKIAKEHFPKDHTVVRQKNRLAKHHALDCGNPKCYLCGNPRKTHKDKLTAQEHRLFQDLDSVRNKHSNGLNDDEE